MTDKEQVINNFAKDINVPSKEQIIIDTNKYFLEVVDEGGCTVGYRVLHPERLLRDIIKQNKQLARKTQECESLKQEIEILQNNFDTATRDCNDEIEILKQECEELKNTLNKLTRGVVMPTPEPEVINLTDRYRKALEEIEEIVKSLNENRMCFYDDINDCSNCDMNTDCNYLRKSKIIDIISKAKGEGKCQ